MCVSRNYVVCSTGSQIKIYNKKWELLHSLTNIRCICRAIISPDESKLLLIPTSSFFYIISLETFVTTKYMIAGEYSGNLEEIGCWSFDSKQVLLCVQKRHMTASALRIYDVEAGTHHDLLCDQYWLNDIIPIQTLNRYLLVGTKTMDLSNYLIWSYNNLCEVYPIEGLAQFDVAVKVKYFDVNHSCIVMGMSSSVICDLRGKQQSSIVLPKSLPSSLTTVQLPEYIDHPLVALSHSESSINPLSFNVDSINDIVFSEDGQNMYVATDSELLCINTETLNIEARLHFPYGVQNIQMFNDEYLIAETMESLRFVRIVP